MVSVLMGHNHSINDLGIRVVSVDMVNDIFTVCLVSRIHNMDAGCSIFSIANRDGISTRCVSHREEIDLIKVTQVHDASSFGCWKPTLLRTYLVR